MKNEQIKSDNKSLNIIEKPVYYGQKGRALIWYYRYYSAYNMAQISLRTNPHQPTSIIVLNAIT